VSAQTPAPASSRPVVLQRVLVKVNGAVYTKTQLEEDQIAMLQERNQRNLSQLDLQSDEKLRATPVEIVRQACAAQVLQADGLNVDQFAACVGALDPEAVAAVEFADMGIEDRRNRRPLRLGRADLPKVIEVGTDLDSDAVLLGDLFYASDILDVLVQNAG
jgi:hypothetical protein